MSSTSTSSTSSPASESSVQIKDYSSKDEWETYYETENYPFEWYCTWEELKATIGWPVSQPVSKADNSTSSSSAGSASQSTAQKLPPPPHHPNIPDLDKIKSILDLGAGLLQQAIDDPAFETPIKKVAWVDFSHKAVQLQESCLKGYSSHGIEAHSYEFDLTTKDPWPQELKAEYDLIVDKGTMESILCSPKSLVKAETFVEQAIQHLSEGGIFVSVANKTTDPHWTSVLNTRKYTQVFHKHDETAQNFSIWVLKR